MSKYSKHIFALLGGVVCLVIYLITLNPTVTFMDSGELAAAAYTFGIPHPTGYPLFLIIAYLFSHLPIGGSVIYKLNLLSAIVSSLTVVVFSYAAAALLGIVGEEKAKASKSRAVHGGQATKPGVRVSPFNIILISFFSAVIFGLSRTFWSDALSIEVYPLHSLLVCVLVLICLKIYRHLSLPSNQPAAVFAQARKWWALLMIVIGFSFANHMTTVFLLAGVFYLFYLLYRQNRAFSLSILPYLLLVLPGLLLYIILMIRASTEPYFNWSNPQNIAGLVYHMRGGDYSQLMFSSSGVFSKNLKMFFETLPTEFAVASGIVGLIGFIFVFRLDRKVFYFFLLLLLSCLLYSLNYNIRDLQSYFFLSYLVFGLSVGVGLLYIAKWLVASLKLSRNPLLITTVLGILLVVFGFRFNYEANNNSDNHVVEDIALNTLGNIEPNSIFLSYDWGYVYPASLYYQQVEGRRNDLKIFTIRFLAAPWYLETIRKYYPDVYSLCSNEIEDYINSYGGDENARVLKLNKLVSAFISNNFSKFRVYVSYDFAYNKEMKPFLVNFNMQPQGLVYRLRNRNDGYDNSAGVASIGSVFRPYKPDTKEKEKMYIATSGLYFDNAVYHYQNKNLLLAIRFLDKAVELRKDFTEAINLRNRIVKESRSE